MTDEYTAKETALAFVKVCEQWALDCNKESRREYGPEVSERNALMTASFHRGMGQAYLRVARLAAETADHVDGKPISDPLFLKGAF